MANKPSDISAFTVLKPGQKQSIAAAAPAEVPIKKEPSKLKKAGFLVTPEALQQFTILKAEQGRDDRADLPSQPAIHSERGTI
jgi:hypothetical protein